ncbi:unnamed protein product [Cuscuta campestris]|uniref:Uncharacterized protein n=1 Tax=Cuscuta campestris TaxID=132261 RepID=A0A484MD30_9ASTE|nr:unnamed protein product [Cuscuta campestris]
MAGEGHDESNNTRRGDPTVQVQERGEIFFFFRPKVGKEEAQGLDDVQRFYIVLRPESGEKDVEVKQEYSSGKEGAELGARTGENGLTREITSEKRDESRVEGGRGCAEINIGKQQLLRLIVMGRKGLPDPTKNSGNHRSHWGFVEMVTTKTEDVRAALKGEEYDTSTRGHRRVGPARAAGEGVYLILRHNPGKKMHTHLLYKLELPAEDERNEPQEELNIKREASFLIQIKNPEQSQGGGDGRMSGLQRKRRAVYPAHLQAEMGQLRYTPANLPDYLNYEGCEFLLIPASDNIGEELGPDIKSEVDADGAHNCSDLIGNTFPETATITPLLKGTWA